MAHTQTDLDRVKAAIASGELIVQYGDRRVQYRSIEELRQAQALIERELAAEAGTKPVAQFLTYTTTGLE